MCVCMYVFLCVCVCVCVVCNYQVGSKLLLQVLNIPQFKIFKSHPSIEKTRQAVSLQRTTEDGSRNHLCYGKQ